MSDNTKPWQDKERLEELYVEKELSTSEIAEKLECSQPTVYKWLKKHNIKTRNIGKGVELSRKKNPVPLLSQRGYKKWVDSSGGERERVSVHRLLYVAHHGFESVKEKDVHHKNEIPWDNRIENLEALTSAEHASLHHRSQNYETPWKDKNKLQKMYVEKQMSIHKIADKLGCSHETIRNWLDQHDIETRDKSKAVKIAQ